MRTIPAARSTKAPRHRDSSPSVARPWRRRFAGLGALAVATALVLGAASCANGRSEETQDSSGDASLAGGEEAGTPASGAVADKAVEDSGTPEVAPGTETVNLSPRAVILDGRLSVQVENLDDALDGAESAVLDVGGYLSDEQVDNSATSHAGATATYRVPPEQFRPVMAELAGLGEVESQDVSSRDVTTEVADLDSRLATLRTSIDRLRGFLGEATDANQISMLESELTRRESEAASIEAQRRAIGDQVDYATISVEFHSTVVTPPVEESPEGFAAGFDRGIGAAITIVNAGLSVAGFLVPFLPVLLPIAALAIWLRRRHRGHHATPLPSAGT